MKEGLRSIQFDTADIRCQQIDKIVQTVQEFDQLRWQVNNDQVAPDDAITYAKLYALIMSGEAVEILALNVRLSVAPAVDDRFQQSRQWLSTREHLRAFMEILHPIRDQANAFHRHCAEQGIVVTLDRYIKQCQKVLTTVQKQKSITAKQRDTVLGGVKPLQAYLKEFQEGIEQQQFSLAKQRLIKLRTLLDKTEETLNAKLKT